jgi:hypothetical protein
MCSEVRLSVFVSEVGDVRSNLKVLLGYLLSQNEVHRKFVREKLKLGYNLVAARVGGEYFFGPSRVIGYKSISVEKHKELGEQSLLDGRDTNPVLSRLLGPQVVKGDPGWHQVETIFLRLCERIDVIPSDRERKYWVLDDLTPQPSSTYAEGALSTYLTSRYERDPKARAACIQAHGLSCIVCNFNFETTFGEHGRGFIHVHHLNPLSNSKPGTVTDPLKDLVPVCPNCHYMLHHRDQLLSIEQLRSMRKKLE